MEKVNAQSIKKEKKLREFREYLADKGVVLAMVKFLLELKNNCGINQSTTQLIQDYFGHYKDPLWDEVDNMQIQIEELQSNIERNEQKVQELQDKILKVKREDDVKSTFELLDTDKSGVLSTKQLVQKLSGITRFDTDYKLNEDQFVDFVIEHLVGNDEESEENWKECYLPMKEAGIGEDGKQKSPPFLGKTEENPWIRIQEKIRSYNNKK